MADIDRTRFAEDVTAALARDGRAMRAIVAENPGLSLSALSRAAAGTHEPHPGNYLAVCRALGLDPWACFVAVKRPPKRGRVTLKSITNQHVSRGVSREAGGQP